MARTANTQLRTAATLRSALLMARSQPVKQQNYFKMARDLSQIAYWTRNNVTPSLVTIPGPFGEDVQASLLTEDNASNYHRVYPTATINLKEGRKYCCMTFVKAKERNYGGVFMDMGPGGTNQRIINLTTGAVAISTNGSLSKNQRTIVKQMLNGWWLVAMSYLHTTNVGILPSFPISADGATVIYAGDGASGIYTWHQQFVEANWEGPLCNTTGTEINIGAGQRIRDQAL